MQNPTSASSANPKPTRREFLKSTAAATAAGAALDLGIARAAYVQDDPTLRVGLVGCGGRGTGAAGQTLRADPYTKLVAMGDVFEDHLEKSLENLQKSDVAEQIEVSPENLFAGLDAYQKVVDSDVDIVLLATPPQFRPQHLKACIDGGKHVFAEKPVAVDPTGVRSVLNTSEEAREKNLFVVSGLCWRYETGMQEMVKRLHNGEIGDIVALHSVRYGGGVWDPRRTRDQVSSDLEYQLRNWYYYTWLSGDFNVEQFVHEMDKMSWIMGDEYPVSCISTGGRQTRTDKKYGNIYDHFSTIFEYENGVKYVATTRHQAGCSNSFFDHVSGSKGAADLMKYEITGENPWRRRERRTDMHQLEHNAMYAAMRNGEYINNGNYMAKSTMLGIMARMSAYTGKELTWEQAMNSELNLTPDPLSWDTPLPLPEVAVPGVTPFV